MSGLSFSHRTTGAFDASLPQQDDETTHAMAQREQHQQQDGRYAAQRPSEIAPRRPHQSAPDLPLAVEGFSDSVTTWRSFRHNPDTNLAISLPSSSSNSRGESNGHHQIVSPGPNGAGGSVVSSQNPQQTHSHGIPALVHPVQNSQGLGASEGAALNHTLLSVRPALSFLNGNPRGSQSPSAPTRGILGTRARQEISDDESSAQGAPPDNAQVPPAKRPRLPGACTRCKRLKIKCEFMSMEDVDPCRRCKSGGHFCIVEGRKQRRPPRIL